MPSLEIASFQNREKGIEKCFEEIDYTIHLLWATTS